MQHRSLPKVYLQVLLQVGVVLFNHGAEDIVRDCCTQCLLWKGFGPRFVANYTIFPFFWIPPFFSRNLSCGRKPASKQATKGGQPASKHASKHASTQASKQAREGGKEPAESNPK